MTDGKGIKYETMNFLSLPPKDIFLASVLIGSLGAIMDVAITIASGMHEILQRTPYISMRRWALAGRNIGQDIMGTMTNILLFSYLSGALPMFLIFLKKCKYCDLYYFDELVVRNCARTNRRYRYRTYNSYHNIVYGNI